MKTTIQQPKSTTSSRLERSVARDVMHSPIVACDPTTPIAGVAGLMSANHIHCVIVEGVTANGGGERLVWGVVSDVDLLRAASLAVPSLTAQEMAGGTPLTVAADDDLVLVSATLTENGCSHVVVVEADRPVGVISTLDIVAAIAQPSNPDQGETQ